MDSDIKEIILTFGGVIIGFGLSEGATFLRAYRSVTTEGRAFDFDVRSYKPILKEQIDALKKYHSAVVSYQDVRPLIVISESSPFVGIDRHKIIKYYSRKHKPEEALRLTSLRLNRFAVVHSELERFKKSYEQFNASLEKILHAYTDATNTFVHEIAECYRKWLQGDEYALRVLKLAHDLGTEPVFNIAARKISVHDALLKMDMEHVDHKYHDIIRQFNISGSEAIADFEVLNRDFSIVVNTFIFSLEHCYKDLYGSRPNT